MVTTAWSLTIWPGSRRSSMKSLRWRVTSLSGDRGTAASSSQSLCCWDHYKSWRAEKTTPSRWASKLSWEWESSSIWFWRTYICLRLAKKNKHFDGNVYFNGLVLWISLHQWCLTQHFSWPCWTLMCFEGNLFLNMHLFIHICIYLST